MIRSDVHSEIALMGIKNMNKITKTERIKLFKDAPVIPAGKYRGLKVSSLTKGQLFWVLGQKFSPERMSIAKLKYETMSHCDVPIEVTRHAYDAFSLRFLGIWQESNLGKLGVLKGIGTFISEVAQEALVSGENISKPKDRTTRTILYRDIKFVFNKPKDGEKVVLITIMSS